MGEWLTRSGTQVQDSFGSEDDEFGLVHAGFLSLGEIQVETISGKFATERMLRGESRAETDIWRLSVCRW